MDALDLLTEDGWREVFKKVWSPEDLKSCSETSTTFEGILERKKTTWMFDAILPHVLQYLVIPGASNQRRGWGIENWNAVQTCRRVCKGWHKSVDHYLESHNSYFPGLFIPMAFDYWLQFKDALAPGTFTQMFEDYTGNPFIGRFIHFVHSGLLDHPQGEPNQQENHTLNLRQIFNRFGSEIWSICVDNIVGVQDMSFCKNIRFLLGILPNLKSLHLKPSFEEDPGIGQLPAFLAANPLPDHPNLENLVIEWPSNGMTGSLLEKYGPQLKRLHLDYGRAVTDNIHRFQDFQVLKELEISTNPRTGTLTSLRQLRSPLTSLRIDLQIGIYSTRDEWPIDQFIRNILHLPLTDLWIITWIYFKANVDAFPASLQHGSIRRVKITSYTRSSLSFNFLRCFPNLEEVHFKITGVGIPKPIYESNLLIVSSEEEDMYEAPVWEAIPSLRLISVKAPGARWPKEYRRSTFEMLRMEKTKEILADLF